jgi:hypothetical protein
MKLNPLHKQKIATAVLIAVLTVSIFMVMLPSVNGAVRIRTPYDTFAYLSAVPDPIGVNQMALVTFRVDQPLAGATIRSGLANGTTVTITRPDGTTETKGPFTLG